MDLENIIKDKKSDGEMIKLAKNELLLLEKNRETNENKLKIFLCPKIKMTKKCNSRDKGWNWGIRSNILCRFV